MSSDWWQVQSSATVALFNCCHTNVSAVFFNANRSSCVIGILKRCSYVTIGPICTKYKLAPVNTLRLVVMVVFGATDNISPSVW